MASKNRLTEELDHKQGEKRASSDKHDSDWDSFWSGVFDSRGGHGERSGRAKAPKKSLDRERMVMLGKVLGDYDHVREQKVPEHITELLASYEISLSPEAPIESLRRSAAMLERSLQDRRAALRAMAKAEARIARTQAETARTLQLLIDR